MLVTDDYSLHAWVYILKHTSDSGRAFRKFYADERANVVPSKVDIVKSDSDGGSFRW